MKYVRKRIEKLLVKLKLHPVPIKSSWYHLGVDFIGPLTISDSGNRFILTVMDYFSKWAIAVSLPTKCKSATSDTLYKVFMTFGLPKLITTDQGCEFTNCLLMKLLHIDHRLTTPYHPQVCNIFDVLNLMQCFAFSII